MTSFFYVISITFRRSVPAFRKCMDISRTNFSWLRALPLVHRLLHLFVGPERLVSHLLFERSKDVKIIGVGGRSGEYGGFVKHSTDRSWMVATVERAVWAEHCHI